MGITDIFKRTDYGFMNSFEHPEEGIIRKKFDTGILSYADIVAASLSLLQGYKMRSGKGRKRAEEKSYRKLENIGAAGVSTPAFIGSGKDYIDIEYIPQMEVLSGILESAGKNRDEKLSIVRKAAEQIKSLHDADFDFANAAAQNTGYKDGKPVLYDFEFEWREKNSEERKKKDISAFAASVAAEVEPSEVRGFLKAISKGYGKDVAKGMEITPHSYMAFFLEGKFGNLHELRKARKYGLGR